MTSDTPQRTLAGRRTIHGLTIVGTWAGGPYIDLHWIERPYGNAVMAAAKPAFDVINVWDYRTNQARIDLTTPGAIGRAIDDWYHSLGDTGRERAAELRNYHRHTAPVRDLSHDYDPLNYFRY